MLVLGEITSYFKRPYHLENLGPVSGGCFPKRRRRLQSYLPGPHGRECSEGSFERAMGLYELAYSVRLYSTFTDFDKSIEKFRDRDESGFES